jgi:hypothetical protein
MDFRFDRRLPVIALACLLALAAGAAAIGAGGEQTPPARSAAVNPDKLTPFIVGARECASCHDQKHHSTFTREELGRWICRMDEFPTFNTQDKHKLAFKGLTGPRGQQMGELLGTDVTKAEAGCINCHGVPEHGVPKQQYTREDDGVTCVACHGTYKEWVLNHQIPDKEWSELPPKDKERRFGMTDLWDPVRRTETCASCHIGNHPAGKVITHAMYAAGHPPLPSLETATFGDAQPRHWDLMRKKTPEHRQRLGYRDLGDFEQTRLVMLGSLVELRESVKLLADQAEANKPEPIGARWPDYARFDCYACHHELESRVGASWRQIRRQTDFPGRPTAADWPRVLVQLAIEAADPARSSSLKPRFNEILAAFQKNLTARPFGDVSKLIPAARDVIQWADSAISSLERTGFDADKARSLLGRLCEMAGDGRPDYDSARQIAWAFRVIYHESVPKERREPAIERELAGLEAELDLDLTPARTQAQIETALPDRLRKAADFDPAPFQAHFAWIAKCLGVTPTPRAQAARR